MSWIWRAAWSFAYIAIVAIVPAAAVQGANVSALNQQSVKLHNQGKDKEATAIAEKAVGLAQRTLGPDHLDTLKSLYNLASLYEAGGRYGEAEPLLKRASAGFERVSARMTQRHSLPLPVWPLFINHRAALQTPNRSSGALWRASNSCAAPTISRCSSAPIISGRFIGSKGAMRRLSPFINGLWRGLSGCWAQSIPTRSSASTTWLSL